MAETSLGWLSAHHAEIAADSPRRKYLALVREVLALAPSNARVLKTDAYNESTGREPISGVAPGCTVLELYGKVCREAKARCPGLHVVPGDIRSMPFPDASFDVILDLSTIDHIPDPARAFDEYRRVLVPGGMLLVVAWINLDDATRFGRSGYGGTQYFFDYRTFRAAIAARFDIIDARILTPAGIDPARLILGGTIPFADLHAYIGRRK